MMINSGLAVVFSAADRDRVHESEGMYRGADKSLARPGRKKVTATEDFEFHISNL